MKIGKQKYKPGILSFLLFPMLIAFFLQIIIVLGIYFKSRIFENSNENSCSVLTEKVLRRKINIESEMKTRWTAFLDMQDNILSKINSETQKHGKNFNDLKTDIKLQSEVISSLVPDFIYILRKNYVTGVFLVLDTPALSEDKKTSSYPGLYIRNNDPHYYSLNNEDLLFARGSAEAAVKHKLAMDIEWKPAFNIANDINDKDSAYFHLPIKTAKKNNAVSGKNFHYWSPAFYFTDSKNKVITYSLPLIDKNGTIYGVIGIDITESYFKTLLNYEELQSDKNGIYCLAVRDKNDVSGEFKVIISNGKTENCIFAAVPEFKIKDTDYPNVYILDSPLFKEKSYAAIQSFNLYPRNGNFENIEWALVGVVAEKDVLYFSFRLRRIFWLSIGIAIVLFTTVAFISTKYLSQILNRVVVRLKHIDIAKQISIQKMNVREIDILISAIENLSKNVFYTASRVSQIIEQLDMPIGVFDYDMQLGSVFCNSVWFKLFNIDLYQKDTTLTEAEFYGILNDLKKYIDIQYENQTVYVLPTGEHGKSKWIRFTMTEDNDRILGTALDITKETEEYAQLEVQMNFDDLTGLYNRSAFDREISGIFSKKDLGICAVVVWDVDNLKYINDSYGLSCGDAYLSAFGKKLMHLQQDRCLVCRRSGDEFYSFFYNFSSAGEIKAILNSFWEEIQKTVVIFPNGGETKVRVSAGIAWYPYDADNQKDLIRYADFAMYNAKHSFKGSMHEFNEEIYKKNYILLQGTGALDEIIEKELVEYAMQPIISAKTGQIYGYEMLMRSMMPEFKNPEDVLRLARAQSKLHQLEELSLFHAMDTYVKKVESGEIDKNTKVFLNTISSQILSETKITEFEKRFDKYLSNIVLEITESDPLDAVSFSIKREKIKTWNAMIAIDDFGSGYSNSSSLIFLSPNIVKIDMSIVRDIHENADKQSILENLMSYARKRDIIVLAEGVEIIEEVEILLKFGVDLFQGYFFAKPDFDIKPIPKDRLSVLTSGNAS